MTDANNATTDALTDALAAKLTDELGWDWEADTYEDVCSHGGPIHVLSSKQIIHDMAVELAATVVATLAAEGVTRNTGAQAIAAERKRQQSIEGYTPEHDAEHGPDALVQAATAYLHSDAQFWPWSPGSFKRTTLERDLVKAGALIAAALDVLATRYTEGGS